MNSLTTLLQNALGLGIQPKDLSYANMLMRALVIFFAALIMLRIADKRSFARKSPFDIVLAFILGSTLSRSINGSAPLLESIVSGFALVLLHRAMAFAARISPPFSRLIKGRACQVIDDGEIVQRGMSQQNLTTGDLIEDLRLNGSTNDPAEVAQAWIERNGDLSVLKKPKPEGGNQ